MIHAGAQLVLALVVGVLIVTGEVAWTDFDPFSQIAFLVLPALGVVHAFHAWGRRRAARERVVRVPVAVPVRVASRDEAWGVASSARRGAAPRAATARHHDCGAAWAFESSR